MEPFYGYFHRSESRELAECYVTGLLMDGERKSVEPVSEKVNASERSMQRLLSDVKWDEEGVAAEYRSRMLSSRSDPMGILVLDDTGFPKKGHDTVWRNTAPRNGASGRSPRAVPAKPAA
jgi:SRSO17 transposase